MQISAYRSGWTPSSASTDGIVVIIVSTGVRIVATSVVVGISVSSTSVRSVTVLVVVI